MAIYEITLDRDGQPDQLCNICDNSFSQLGIQPNDLHRTTFADLGISEEDLQDWLSEQPEIIAPGQRGQRFCRIRTNQEYARIEICYRAKKRKLRGR
jgi:hypothetical protein